jgi:hypothetical protein
MTSDGGQDGPVPGSSALDKAWAALGLLAALGLAAIAVDLLRTARRPRPADDDGGADGDDTTG